MTSDKLCKDCTFYIPARQTELVPMCTRFPDVPNAFEARDSAEHCNGGEAFEDREPRMEAMFD